MIDFWNGVFCGSLASFIIGLLIVVIAAARPPKRWTQAQIDTIETSDDWRGP
jgi:hypothetical protein